MSALEMARCGMAFRMAHGLWFARLISETRAGRVYTAPEPRLADFLKGTT